jgi:hypothetical protein
LTSLVDHQLRNSFQASHDSDYDTYRSAIEQLTNTFVIVERRLTCLLSIRLWVGFI